MSESLKSPNTRDSVKDMSLDNLTGMREALDRTRATEDGDEKPLDELAPDEIRQSLREGGLGYKESVEIPNNLLKDFTREVYEVQEQKAHDARVEQLEAIIDAADSADEKGGLRAALRELDEKGVSGFDFKTIYNMSNPELKMLVEAARDELAGMNAEEEPAQADDDTRLEGGIDVDPKREGDLDDYNSGVRYRRDDKNILDASQFPSEGPEMPSAPEPDDGREPAGEPAEEPAPAPASRPREELLRDYLGPDIPAPSSPRVPDSAPEPTGPSSVEDDQPFWGMNQGRQPNVPREPAPTGSSRHQESQPWNTPEAPLGSPEPVQQDPDEFPPRRRIENVQRSRQASPANADPGTRSNAPRPAERPSNPDPEPPIWQLFNHRAWKKRQEAEQRRQQQANQ